MGIASADAVEQHPHLGEPCPDGWVRVDMHSHTMWSGDSTTTPDELIDAVTASGIDALCITDHQVISGALELQRELPCRVIVGEELRTGFGELIGLFLAERITPGIPPAEAARQIRDQGGIVYIPHPFDPMRNNLDGHVIDELVGEGLVDAIETINAKTSLSSLNRRATSYADDHGLGRGAGSDGHVPGAIGAAYVEVPDFDGPAEFLEALHAGRAVGHHWDEPRVWTPRIIPSTAP